MDNIPLAASKKRQEHQAVNNAWSCLEPSACTECNPVETTDCRVTSMNCNGSLESHRTFQNSAVAMTKLCSDFQRQCGSTSDNDSGCALEEFAWVPPGVRIEQVYQYFSHLPDDLVPFIGSVGEQRRQQQLAWQLPLQDTDVEHCQQLAEDELQEHSNFNEQLKKEALGQGSIRQIPLTLDTVNCTKCEGPIEPGDVALFAARAGSNCQWHPQCFVCEECEELLVNLIYFYKDEKIYCGRHYAEKQKPRCNFCDELIFAEECTEAEGSCWHIKHFACFECKRQLGGTRYVMRDRVPYCCECFDRRLAEYCAACGKPIRVDEGQMSYGTQFWHASDTCFRCSTCDRVLLGRHFLSTNSSLYCSIECSRGITTHSDSHSIHQSPVSHSTELSPIQERLQCSDDPWIFRRSSEERFGGGVLPPPIRRSLPDLTTEDELTDVDRRPPPLPPKTRVKSEHNLVPARLMEENRLFHASKQKCVKWTEKDVKEWSISPIRSDLPQPQPQVKPKKLKKSAGMSNLKPNIKVDHLKGPSILRQRIFDQLTDSNNSKAGLPHLPFEDTSSRNPATFRLNKNSADYQLKKTKFSKQRSAVHYSPDRKLDLDEELSDELPCRSPGRKQKTRLSRAQRERLSMRRSTKQIDAAEDPLSSVSSSSDSEIDDQYEAEVIRNGGMRLAFADNKMVASTAKFSNQARRAKKHKTGNCTVQ